MNKTNPGPGWYEPMDYSDMKNDRVYFLSQWKSPGTRRFGTSKRLRNEGLSNAIPGPGTYRPPSEFGYLDSLKSPRT